jgi:hypothetical protein
MAIHSICSIQLSVTQVLILILDGMSENIKSVEQSKGISVMSVLKDAIFLKIMDGQYKFETE